MFYILKIVSHFKAMSMCGSPNDEIAHTLNHTNDDQNDDNSYPNHVTVTHLVTVTDGKVPQP